MMLMVLRGPLASVNLLKKLVNPFFNRNLTAAPIRHVQDGDRKKSEGMFSWLKDILKSGVNVHGVRNAIQCEATVHDNPRNLQTELNNDKLENKISASIGPIGMSLKNPEAPVSSLGNTKNEIHFDNGWSYLDSRSSRNSPEHKYRGDLASVSHSRRINKLPMRDVFLYTPDRTDIQVRTIVGCMPRNTKPPIREPNMPEKQEKKDDKKEKKKKKKPVIRMEGGLLDNFPKQATTVGEKDLHDNLGVNFWYQWAIRLPEEKPAQKFGNNYDVPPYSLNTIQDRKNFHVNMSSAKDVSKESEIAKELPVESMVKPAVAGTIIESKEKVNAESADSAMKASPSSSIEANVADEEYNVPSNATFDAEVSAWKDLAMRSKVQADLSKEEFNDTERRPRPEMLSIRPEPPEPKLDVKAVQIASSEEDRDEDEESDMHREMKTPLKAIDGKRPGTIDAQKLDNKKLHTGVFCFWKGKFRRYERTQLRGSSLLLDFSKAHNATNRTFVSSNYSTEANSTWGTVDHILSKGKRTEDVKAGQPDSAMRNRETEKPNADRVETLSVSEATTNRRQMSSDDEEADFGDGFNATADKEAEVSLGHAQQNAHEKRDRAMHMVSERDSKVYDPGDYPRAETANFQGNLSYQPYEDDFYPNYDNMALEQLADNAPTERTQSNKHRQSMLSKQSNWTNNDSNEIFTADNEANANLNEYDNGGNYIKVPGDPYPYSKEHFNKWKLPREAIRVGHATNPKEEDLFTMHDSNRLIEYHPSRKMSTTRSSYRNTGVRR